MPQLAKDSNHSTTLIRQGDPVGGVYRPGTSIALDTWHRLMPSGTATKVDGNLNQLNIGALRADILGSDINVGWHIYIVNDLYEQERRIKDYNSDTHILTTIPEGQLEFDKLPDSVEFVIAPFPINPITIVNRESGTNNVLIGYSPKNKPDNVIELAELAAGKAVTIPATNVHKLFYRYSAIVAADELEWGEHYTYTP